MAKRKRNKRRRTATRPKGSYPLPNGNYVVTGSWGPPKKRGRRIRVVAVRRDEIDADKVAQAVIAIVLERAERDRHDHDNVT
jgi:hypothetical protein